MIAEATVKSNPTQWINPQSKEEISRPVRRISLEEYHRLIKLGFFRPEEKLELIQGLLTQMPPVYPRHATTVSLMTRQLFREIADKAEVRIQQPITLPSVDSEPEPDFLIAQGDAMTYAERHPQSHEILLIGEVSDSTLAYDRAVKVPLYATAGIKEYWIANAQDNQLEIYREPEMSADGTQGIYRTKITFEIGDTVAPLAFPDAKISLKEIFPY